MIEVYSQNFDLLKGISIKGLQKKDIFIEEKN